MYFAGGRFEGRMLPAPPWMMIRGWTRIMGGLPSCRLKSIAGKIAGDMIDLVFVDGGWFEEVKGVFQGKVPFRVTLISR